MQTTVLNVRERLDNARSRLPERAERPTLLTSDPGERPIGVLALSTSGDLRALSRTAEEVYARRFEQIVGVASVAVVGAPEDEIRVEADPARLRALGLTPNDLATAIRDANPTGASGTIRRGQFRFAVRTLTEFRDPQEILDVPLGPAGSGIKVRDVATIAITTADPTTLTQLDGKRAVGLVVYKDAGANTVAVTRELRTTVDQLTKEFPALTLTVVAAQADFVVDALSNLGQEILVGGIISLLLILIFLRDWRMSMAIGVMIPLSVLVALVILQLLDVTINVLSLGGLALGVGLLVDNAIVVTEATARKRDEGLPLLRAAIEAGEEVSGPLIAGTLTTLLVFGPIIFVRGLAAALFRDLSLAVVTSVGASLVLALTLMPVLIAGRRAGGQAVASGDRPTDHRGIGAALTRWYETGMRWSLAHPGLVFAIAGLATIGTAWLAVQLPREILPAVNERVAVAQLQLAEGTAIEETARQVARLEEVARSAGSRNIYSRIGVATDEEVLAGAEPGSSAAAQMLIPVPDGTDATVFADRLRGGAPDLARGALAIDLAGQSEFGSLIGREGRTVRVEISARTLDEAARWADSVRRRMMSLASLTDVRSSQQGAQPVVEVGLERARMSDRGVTIDEVTNALAGGLGGVEASELRETDRRTKINVRYKGAASEDIESALSTVVRGTPVREFVAPRETSAPVEVVRVGQRPVVAVEGLVSEQGGGTSGATSATNALLSSLTFPPGVSWVVTGADTEQRRTTSELSLVALLSVALVFLVLAGEFASFRIPLVVMLTVPLAAAGGILFLWLTGQSINAVSLIGIVVMIGMADNEAVVKLDAIRRFEEAGMSLHDAIVAGGHQRLRAIAMSNLTTITGVLPLVFGWGSGGELYQPLAAGVIGGSISALLVTFFLLPTAYAVSQRGKMTP
jgi:HAE1 family hydrophobic/amphiphilic exporter-1